MIRHEVWSRIVYLISVVVIVCNGLYCQWFVLIYYVSMLQYYVNHQKNKNYIVG